VCRTAGPPSCQKPLAGTRSVAAGGAKVVARAVVLLALLLHVLLHLGAVSLVLGLARSLLLLLLGLPLFADFLEF
jgi:hypothetical protein